MKDILCAYYNQTMASEEKDFYDLTEKELQEIRESASFQIFWNMQFSNEVKKLEAQVTAWFDNLDKLFREYCIETMLNKQP